jgi:hypothetical protein
MLIIVLLVLVPICHRERPSFDTGDKWSQSDLRNKCMSTSSVSDSITGMY